MLNLCFCPTLKKRILFFFIVDFILFFISLYFAYQFRFNFYVPAEYMVGFWKMVWYLITIKLLMLYIFKVYHVVWRYFGLSDARNLLISLIVSYLIFLPLVYLFYDGYLARSIFIIDFFLSLVFIGVFRFSKRIYLESSGLQTVNPTVIIGANSKSINIIKSALNSEINFNPVTIVDDQSNVINTYLANIKVHPMSDLPKLIEEHDINSAIITKEFSPEELDTLFESLDELKVKNIKLAKLLNEKNDKLRDISIEDLLARKPKDLDKSAIENFIKDKIVLITGAGGSIGSELARQCKGYGAKQLILIDNSEYNLYKLSEEILGENITTLLLSILDKDELEKCFSKYKPDVILHAAAYKHVHLVEQNVDTALRNNIIGTKICVDLAIKYGVKKFVFISTDKAVRPTNVMGATKRVCELYVQNIDTKETEIVSVRFGNVLGSSGSVIPKFKDQIEHNTPLTVTHPKVTRYFMLIPEACQLVLQAAAIAGDNELFVLDMGKPIKISSLARKMLRIYGKKELGIEYTGLRPGEKLYEELLIDKHDKKTIYDSIFVANPTHYGIEKLTHDIEELLETEDKIKKLQEIIPEFDHKVV